MPEGLTPAGANPTRPPERPQTSGIAAALAKRGIDDATWSTLKHSVYPGARPESILLVLDYCRARKLDPLKKPVHIVPMEVRDAATNSKSWRDVVLPGIYEHRTTAQRTGEYRGHTPATWGPEIDYRGIKAFDWCELTVFRGPRNADHDAFPVRVYFREVVQLNNEGKVNARWSRAPLQMLLKCTEAAALREAFPDELGGQHTAEEMDGSRADAAEDEPAVDAKILPPKPERFDDWILDMQAKADEGDAALRVAWKESVATFRDYLLAADPSLWNAIKDRARDADAARIAYKTTTTNGVAK